MGLLDTLMPPALPLYTTASARKGIIVGYVEGIADYDPASNNKTKAIERAKTELRRQAVALKADAIINVRIVCFPGTSTSIIMIYGDAIMNEK
jgi:uncharacterized protein YbjQ (UPF0145 family)